MSTPSDRETRFTTVYTHSYDDVLRFVQRRVETGAEDVVAEAMTVAWRRVDDMPDTLDDARAWIFGIARHCLLNSRRSDRRQEAVGVRLAHVEDGVAADDADAVVSRVDLARAWTRLTPGDQEVLALTVFDGLDSPAAGRVLGVSPVAYRLRLSRARGALRRALETPGRGGRPSNGAPAPPRRRPPLAAAGATHRRDTSHLTDPQDPTDDTHRETNAPAVPQFEETSR